MSDQPAPENPEHEHESSAAQPPRTPAAPSPSLPPASYARPAPAPTPTRPPSSMRRILALNGLGLIVVALIALSIFYLWHQGYYFYSTDDASVSGTFISVAPAAPGTVESVSHNLGDTVRAGDTVATIRTARGGTVDVKSPIDGTILQESATVGQVVGPGQPLAQAVDLSKVLITAYVEETHIGDVRRGQGVDVTIDHVKGTSFHGTVTRVAPVAASALSLLPTTDYASGNYTKVTQRVPVQMTLDGFQGHTLYPGTSAEVTIHIHE